MLRSLFQVGQPTGAPMSGEAPARRRRRAVRIALVLVGMAIAVLAVGRTALLAHANPRGADPSGSDRRAAMRGAVPVRGGTPDSVSVIVRNTRPDSVRVEVRVGTAATCEANTLVAVATLPAKRRWTIWSDATVCWRTEQLPVGSEAWLPWHVYRGHTVAVDDSI